MAIVPSGHPAWARTAAHTDYGGDLNKRNFLSQGVIDAQTDVGADQFSRMVADLAALTRVAPFAVITYLNNDSSPAAPTVNVTYLMTGVRSTSYAGNAAPTGFPSAARNGTGDVTFTFAATYTDEYGVSYAFAPSIAFPSVVSTITSNATAVVSGATVRVRCFSGGAAFGDQRASLLVW